MGVLSRRAPAAAAAAMAAVMICLAVACKGREELWRIEIGEAELWVEIADTPEERQLGLMHRDSLAPDRGMLFVYDRDQRMAFHMKNTKVPLSIAFIASDGRILEIHEMKPLSLDPVLSSRSARYALEVNLGAFERMGVGVGDYVRPLPARR